MANNEELAPADYWRRCNSCKKPIAYKSLYWVCNVSTCNRKRTGLVFCEVSCWDAHVPMMNHRESWAEERRSPSREEWLKILSGPSPEDKPVRKRAEKSEEPTQAAAPASSGPKVILRRSRAE
jgi:hypothetical protein